MKFLSLIFISLLLVGCTNSSKSNFTIATNSYTNPNNKFSINYPSKFKYQENLWKGSTSFSVSFFEDPNNTKFGLPIGISIFEGNSKRTGTDFGGYIRTVEAIDRLKSKQPNQIEKVGESYYKKISEIELSSFKGIRFYELDGFDPTKISAEDIALIKRDTAYLISSTLDMTKEENKLLFNEMIQSFKVN